jgi:hypothetical protein
MVGAGDRELGLLTREEANEHGKRSGNGLNDSSAGYKDWSNCDLGDGLGIDHTMEMKPFST